MQKIRRLFIVKRALVKNEISKRSMKKRKKSENEKKKNWKIIKSGTKEKYNSKRNKKM